jgi:serine/threonine protein phosphatase PrpC
MIIASDGLWEFISCEQAMSIVVPSFLRNDPDEGARQLERAALQHWSREENVIDDISIIVAFFRNY